MSETDKTFAGSIPALYDRHLGPMLFEPYALDMAERVARLAPKRILEIAAGTGIVTRALARALPTVPIVATDLNQPMLDHAAARISARMITWRQADAQALPFDDAEFDVVVCQFGVMFFPDKTKAFSEARRVLAPGGHFLFSVWDRIEENEIADLVSRAVAALFPKDPPAFLARAPRGGDRRRGRGGRATPRTRTDRRQNPSSRGGGGAIAV
jgi:ubiquinone/menaquinone biosynthesis C-methylase UbiE